MAQKPAPIKTVNIDDARTSLVNSPHKSAMAAWEAQVAESPGRDEEAWEAIKAKAVKRLNDDLYCCLKIERNATSSDIKKAYRKMSLLYHPDKTRIMESSELFQVIKKAYEVLSDEQARASYDHRTKGKIFVDGYTDTKPKNNAAQSTTKPKSTQKSTSTPKPQSSSAPKSKYQQSSTSNQPPPPSSSSSSSSSSYSSSSSKPSSAPKPKPGSKPAAPYAVRVVSIDATSVTLAWKTRDSPTGVTYELQTRLVDKVGWPKSATGISKTACRKKNLEPGTKYVFTVRAISTSGVTSEWSAPLNARTMGDASSHQSTPPPPPRDSTSPERRLDPVNGYPYTFEEFYGYYGSRAEWDGAPVSKSSSKAAPSRTTTPPPPPPEAKKTKTTVPPLKMEWSCSVCKRRNGLAVSSCTVCGTVRGYQNSRMNNISDNQKADTARTKEKERLRERMQASARAAEEDAARKAYTYDYPTGAPPAAGGWARQEKDMSTPPPPPSSFPNDSSDSRSTHFTSSTNHTARATHATPPPPPDYSSSQSSSYSYTNPQSARSTSNASPRANKTPRSPTDVEAAKIASAARKARRAAMRDSLKQPTTKASTNPLHQEPPAAASFTPRPSSNIKDTVMKPPPAQVKSVLSSARRAFGKKMSAGIKQVKTAASLASETFKNKS